MRTPEAGVMHAYRCPHCNKVQTWEVGPRDERREWFHKCDDCGGDVVIRYDAAREGCNAFVP